MVRRVLQISLQADPLATVDGGKTGGQQVLVRQVARSVQMQGYGTDVVTLRDNAHDRPQFSLGPIGQVVRLDVDDMPVHDPDWLNVVDEISQKLLYYIRREGRIYQIIHSHYWTSGLVAARVAKELGVPWIHTPYKLAQWIVRQGEKISAVRDTAELEILNQVDAVVVSYLGEGDLIRRYAPDVTVYVVPPGVEPTQFFSRDAGPILKRLSLSRRPAIYIGRLTSGRGIEMLLQTLSEIQLPSAFCLAIVGGASGEVVNGYPVSPKLRALKERLNEHVRFLGPMPHSAVAPYLAAASVMVAPNQGPTLGMAVVEGMASGLPVVGTDVTGIRDWISDGVDGVLVRPEQLDMAATALLQLWSDSGRARRMGRIGQDRIHRHYGGDKMAEQLVQIYQEVMEHGRHSAGVGY